MSDLVNLEGIPDAARELWTRLLGEDLVPVHELFGQVKEYQQAIHQRSSRDDGVDPALAESLVRASMRLLDTLGESTPEATRQLKS